MYRHFAFLQNNSRGALNVQSMLESKIERLLSVCDLKLCEDGACENHMTTLRPLRVPAPPGALPALGQAHSQARPGVLGEERRRGRLRTLWLDTRLVTCSRSWADSSMGVR